MREAEESFREANPRKGTETSDRLDSIGGIL